MSSQIQTFAAILLSWYVLCSLHWSLVLLRIKVSQSSLSSFMPGWRLAAAASRHRLCPPSRSRASLSHFVVTCWRVFNVVRFASGFLRTDAKPYLSIFLDHSSVCCSHSFFCSWVTVLPKPHTRSRWTTRMSQAYLNNTKRHKQLYKVT